MLHTIVQIKLNHPVGQTVDFFFILMDFLSLRMDLLPLVAQFHTLTARSLCYTLFQLFSVVSYRACCSCT